MKKGNKHTACPICSGSMYAIRYHDGETSKGLKRKYCPKCDKIYQMELKEE